MMSFVAWQSMPRALARRILPSSVRSALHQRVQSHVAWRQRCHLARVRAGILGKPPGSLMRCQEYTVRVNDAPNFYILYKDIFVRRIYHFVAQRRDPLILDCGSNIGMSVLYFKQRYPQARIVAVEPDPRVLPFLEDNIERNHLTGVRIVNQALAAREGMLSFCSDGRCASFLGTRAPDGPATSWQRMEVSCVRLRNFLTEPVDFLKMNIEGMEWEVLADSEDRLSNVNAMVIEYHHLPGLPRTLHKILELLDRRGFEYLVNDFDLETNPGVEPPFALNAASRYCLLIYAQRGSERTS